MAESRKVINPNIVQGAQFYPDYLEVTLTNNTNNLTLSTLSSFTIFEMDSTGNYSLTGIAPPSTSVGWNIKIFNRGTNNIIFKTQDAASLAENRFDIGADKTVQPNEGIELTYRVAKLRWGSTGINI